jgi:hypothetical protein
MAVINPYANVDWQNAQRVLSVSHQHLSHSSEGLCKKTFDDIYGTGVRHFAISRYRPSILTYPAENGKFVYVANPFSETVDIDTLKSMYSVEIDLPSDALLSPNAEHVNSYLYINNAWTKWTSLHINGIGSTHESGLTPNGTYQNSDAGESYRELIDHIIANLQYNDGGGVIFNHCNWTEANLKRSYQYNVIRLLEDCLDYSPYVLGTDVIEDGVQSKIFTHRQHVAPEITGDVPTTIEVWDTVLLTGRRCWGFAQPDWDHFYGRNELLVPSFTERECLKAYREGAFIGRYSNTNLSVLSVSYSAGSFDISTANADKIEIVVDGVSSLYNGVQFATITVPSDAVYVRAVAYKTNPEYDANAEMTQENSPYLDICYTQPIMINPKTYTYSPAYDDYTPTPEPEPEPEPEPDPDPDPDDKKRAWYRKSWMWG